MLPDVLVKKWYFVWKYLLSDKKNIITYNNERNWVKNVGEKERLKNKLNKIPSFPNFTFSVMVIIDPWMWQRKK